MAGENDNMRISAGTEQFIAELMNTIPVGVDNALHQDELASKLHCQKYKIKQGVRIVRRLGCEVLSGANGYWLAENDQERIEFTKMMRKQAITRLKTLNAIKNTPKNKTGLYGSNMMPQGQKHGGNKYE